MSLIKWQPFGELDDSFNRLIPSLFNRASRFGMENGGIFAWPRAPTSTSRASAPNPEVEC